MPGFSRCSPDPSVLNANIPSCCVWPSELSLKKNTSKHTSFSFFFLILTIQIKRSCIYDNLRNVHVYMALHSLLWKRPLMPRQTHREATIDTFVSGQTVTQHISLTLKEATAVCFHESARSVLNPPPAPLPPSSSSRSLSFKLTYISATWSRRGHSRER